MLSSDVAHNASAAVTPEQVRQAIDRGVDYLLKQQRRDGSWPPYANYDGGTTAMCTLALLNAGVPVDDANMQKALEQLRSLPPSKTYVVALQTMALCAAEPKRDKLKIQQLARWLEMAQRRKPGAIGAAGTTRPTPRRLTTRTASLPCLPWPRPNVSASK